VPKRERLAVAALAGAFATAYALLGVFRHWHFSSSAFDLGIFDQVVWHLSRFEVPASTINGHANIFGDHFHPILILFAPLYWLHAGPTTLIVAQAVVLAASIVPVYLFARSRLPAGPALTLAAAYGFFWGMQRTAWFDVHEAAFAPLLIALALWSIDQQRWRVLWLISAGLLLVKEDMAPLVCGFGLYLMVTGQRRQGALLAVTGFVAFGLIVGVAIPWISGQGAWGYEGLYDAVRQQPWMAPVLLVTPVGKVETIGLWLAPFLFLSLASPYGLLLIPVAVERLLSSNSAHWGHGGHYSAPLAPILAIAAADGLSRLARRGDAPVTRRRVIIATATVMLVVSAIVPGRQPIFAVFTSRHYQAARFQDIGEQAVALIPPGASVVAQAAIVPHLSNRRNIFVLDAAAPDADYVIASRDVSAWPEPHHDAITALVEQRKANGYRAIFDRDGWVVLARPGR
jgi:uncharacterized membrane protein